MRYCPDCGTGHDCEAGTGTRTDPAVEIARINADRDVAVARLQARMQRDELDTAETIAETQAEADVETAAVEAEIVAAAIEGGIGEEPEPVVVAAAEDVTEDEPDDAPPDDGGSPAPEPRHKASGIGFW